MTEDKVWVAPPLKEFDITLKTGKPDRPWTETKRAAHGFWTNDNTGALELWIKTSEFGGEENICAFNADQWVSIDVALPKETVG